MVLKLSEIADIMRMSVTAYLKGLVYTSISAKCGYNYFNLKLDVIDFFFPIFNTINLKPQFEVVQVDFSQT